VDLDCDHLEDSEQDPEGDLQEDLAGDLEFLLRPPLNFPLLQLPLSFYLHTLKLACIW
jgi:hypothetical protein